MRVAARIAALASWLSTSTGCLTDNLTNFLPDSYRIFSFDRISKLLTSNPPGAVTVLLLSCVRSVTEKPYLLSVGCGSIYI